MVRIAAIVALAWAATAQDTPRPVFRAGADLVTFEVSVFTRVAFGLINRPYTKLAVDDVTVVFEGNTYPAVKLEQDPKKPGHYLVGFAPPDEYRDGQSHTYQVTVKGVAHKPVTFPPSSVTIPKRFGATPTTPISAVTGLQSNVQR